MSGNGTQQPCRYNQQGRFEVLGFLQALERITNIFSTSSSATQPRQDLERYHVIATLRGEKA